MFTESAEFYDAIYFSFKDYAAEAARVASLIRAERPGARTVLDVACGTGEHARLLVADGFDVDGIDLNPQFLRLARRKVPGGRFEEADMAAFRLGRRYDAVICMFSSIGYVETLARMIDALTCFRDHLAEGGVLLVEPWFPPDKLVPGRVSSRTVEAGGARVTRTSTIEVEGSLSRLRFEYAIDERGQTRSASEVHTLGVFSEVETLAAFASAGLVARHIAPRDGDRGMYVARL